MFGKNGTNQPKKNGLQNVKRELLKKKQKPQKKKRKRKKNRKRQTSRQPKNKHMPRANRKSKFLLKLQKTNRAGAV
jgi:IS5 family transposase